MDPVSLSLAIAPLVLASAKLIAAVGSVGHRYKHAQATVSSIRTECDLMHVALCEVQGLVHRNRLELATRLQAQRILEETFDKVLTGCRATLDALAQELESLLKASKGKESRNGEMRHQAKIHFVWKKDTMDDLTEQMRNQKGSIQFLITILHSNTQVEILNMCQKNASSIQKLLNKAKSIRSSQGFNDTENVSVFAKSFVRDPFEDSYEEQLRRSPAYRKAQTTAAEELLASKLELLEEKYCLEESLDSLRSEMALKDETLHALRGVINDEVKKVIDLQQKNKILRSDVKIKGEEIRKLLQNDKSHERLRQKEERPVLEELSSDGFLNLSKSALYLAAFHGEIQPFTLQMDRELKMVCLGIAAAKGHVEIIKHILKDKGGERLTSRDLDTETEKTNHFTILQLSAARGHNAVVKALIAAGANVNARGAGWKVRNALHLASAGGHIEVVETLLDHGANVNARCTQARAVLWLFAPQPFQSPSVASQSENQPEGMSALEAAANGGHENVIRRLLKADASTPDLGALRSAVYNGHLEVVRELLQTNGDWTGDMSNFRHAAERDHKMADFEEPPLWPTTYTA